MNNLNRRGFFGQVTAFIARCTFFPFIKNLQNLQSDKIPILLTNPSESIISTTTNWSIRHIIDARWDIVERSMTILEKDFIKRTNVTI